MVTHEIFTRSSSSVDANLSAGIVVGRSNTASNRYDGEAPGH